MKNYNMVIRKLAENVLNNYLSGSMQPFYDVAYSFYIVGYIYDKKTVAQDVERCYDKLLKEFYRDNL